MKSTRLTGIIIRENIRRRPEDRVSLVSRVFGTVPRGGFALVAT